METSVYPRWVQCPNKCGQQKYAESEHCKRLCKECEDKTNAWQRERRDAWVRFAAAELLAGAGYPTKACGDAADAMLAEFDARFGKKEEGK